MHSPSQYEIIYPAQFDAELKVRCEAFRLKDFSPEYQDWYQALMVTGVTERINVGVLLEEAKKAGLDPHLAVDRYRKIVYEGRRKYAGLANIVASLNDYRLNPVEFIRHFILSASRKH